MNVMISREHYAGAEKKAAEAVRRQRMILAIEKDCTAFNVSKKSVFDCLNATIDALNGVSDSELNVPTASEATLWAILIAKDSLDTLFATVLQAHMGDY